MNEGRLFPLIRTWQEIKDKAPSQIPWSLAEQAYAEYVREFPGIERQQSLDRLAERGGFSLGELDRYVPDWRSRIKETV